MTEAPFQIELTHSDRDLRIDAGASSPELNGLLSELEAESWVFVAVRRDPRWWWPFGGRAEKQLARLEHAADGWTTARGRVRFETEDGERSERAGLFVVGAPRAWAREHAADGGPPGLPAIVWGRIGDPPEVYHATGLEERVGDGKQDMFDVARVGWHEFTAALRTFRLKPELSIHPLVLTTSAYVGLLVLLAALPSWGGE